MEILKARRAWSEVLWALNENNFRRFQDDSYREEAESMPPKVKSWRDSGDTSYRKNQREQAKL
jgi:hypothetical protein